MTLLPGLSVIGPDGLPLATCTPLTVTVPVASCTVGVTVIVLNMLVMLAVYAKVPLANAGDSVPAESVRFARFALWLAGSIVVRLFEVLSPGLTSPPQGAGPPSSLRR